MKIPVKQFARVMLLIAFFCIALGIILIELVKCGLAGILTETYIHRPMKGAMQWSRALTEGNLEEANKNSTDAMRQKNIILIDILHNGNTDNLGGQLEKVFHGGQPEFTDAAHLAELLNVKNAKDDDNNWRTTDKTSLFVEGKYAFLVVKMVKTSGNRRNWIVDDLQLQPYSPAEVAKKWGEALLRGQIKDANDYSTDNMLAFNGIAVSVIVSANEKKTEDLRKVLKEVSNARAEINGDYARLIVAVKEEIILKNVNGYWKLDQILDSIETEEKGPAQADNRTRSEGIANPAEAAEAAEDTDEAPKEAAEDTDEAPAVAAEAAEDTDEAPKEAAEAAEDTDEAPKEAAEAAEAAESTEKP